jgi:hypothetical protein
MLDHGMLRSELESARLTQDRAGYHRLGVWLVAAWSVIPPPDSRIDLVDEYHLLVYPIVLGGGLRMFEEGSIRTSCLLQAVGHGYQ